MQGGILLVSVLGQVATAPTPGWLETILHEYGWAGVCVFWLIKDVMPWLRKRIDKTWDNGAKLEEAKLARDAAREERSVRAMEQMAETTAAIKTLISAVNVRLEVIERRLDLPTPEPKKGRTNDRSNSI